MDQSVLLHIDECNAPQAMNVFDSLGGVYTKYAKQMGIDKDIHHGYIGRFVATNVMDMLYEKNNESRAHFKVHCIMEYKHRFMKLVPVWSNSVRNAVELERIGVRTNISQQHGRYWCDLCGVEVSRYDWIYRCDNFIGSTLLLLAMCMGYYGSTYGIDTVSEAISARISV
eukprot:292368_1